MENIKLIEQAQSLERSGNLREAEQHYRQVIASAPASEAGYVGLVHVLAKQNLGRSNVDIYRDELDVFERAHSAGIWPPEIVVPLACLYWEHLGELEKGVALVEQYIQKETDISRVRNVIYSITDELTSQIPPQCASVLRLHATFQNESPIALTPYDRIYPFLKGAPGDLQYAYFELQQSNKWITTINCLWSQLGRSQRRKLRQSYLSLIARGCHKAGLYEEAIETGRKYLRYIRESLQEPFRSSNLAQEYANTMAPSYQALGRSRQVAQAFRKAEHYLSRYEYELKENPLTVEGWTIDQFVAPYANVGYGALMCQQDAAALRLFRTAQSIRPGHIVVLFQLAGLVLEVEHDRDTSLRYLQQAVTTASSQRGTGGKLVRSWFRNSRLFGAVQDDDAFLQVVGRE